MPRPMALLQEAKNVLLTLLDDTDPSSSVSLEEKHLLLTRCWGLLAQCDGQAYTTPVQTLPAVSHLLGHQNESIEAEGGEGDEGGEVEFEPVGRGPRSMGSSGTGQADPEELELLWSGLVQQVYLLAMDLLIASLHSGSWEQQTADSWLWQLGLRWRLADPVWATCRPSAPSSSRHDATGAPPSLTAPSPSTPRAGCAPAVCGKPGKSTCAQVSTTQSPQVLDADAALPEATFSALQQAFSAPSPFWSDHQYNDPDTPFFSYAYDLSQQPSNVVELAARQLKQHPLLAEMLAGATHVEWWAHLRAPPGPGQGTPGHQLHFDCDETLLRKGAAVYRLRHPRYSSVLYLTSSPHAGPTLILDQTAGQQQPAAQAWAVQPAAGRYLLFPGNLLHGVLPGAVGGMTVGRQQGGACVGGVQAEQSVAGEPQQEPGTRNVGVQGEEQQAQVAVMQDGGGNAIRISVASGEAECCRTTLMLAWWEQPAAGSHTIDESAGTSMPEGLPHLRPWMVAPSAATTRAANSEENAERVDYERGCERCKVDEQPHSTPSWVGFFHELMLGALVHKDCDAESCNVATAGTGRVWRPAPVRPAWRRVQPALAAAAGSNDAEQDEAGLPGVLKQVLCSAVPDLRFFLPDVSVINDLYPSSISWTHDV